MAMDDNQASDAAKNLKAGIANVVETGSDLAGKAQTAAAQAGSTIRDAAIETSQQVGDAAAKTYAQGSQAAEYLSRQTAEQPLLALLVAGAIGYAIAYMIHSR
jgi:ElaB/YqjD/DUF883 family membrane-anchored ribosome-binding protein